MLYEFREVRADGLLGELAELEFPVERAPGIGVRRRRRGRVWQRVPSAIRSSSVLVDRTGDEPYIASTLPLNYEPHRLAGGEFAKRGDIVGGRRARGGEPVMTSRRQQDLTKKAAWKFSEHDRIDTPALKPLLHRHDDDD